ncbi:MAG: PilZ domain-containing protein [Desulfamplus sp.]|nr:PilZ domain-containing protein [Desulfamplus sp.]
MVTIENTGRRNYQRVPFSTRIILIHSDNEVDITGNSANLSVKGLFVKTEKKVSPGMACTVKIILSGGIDEIELLIHARITRVEDNGMGIVFDAMDLETYTHLKNIVQYNSANGD